MACGVETVRRVQLIPSDEIQYGRGGAIDVEPE
jgi:hypothetical protein